MLKIDSYNKKIVFFSALVLILLLAFIFAQKFLKPSQEPAKEKSFLERITEFKVAKEGIPQETIDRLFKEFTTYKDQVIASPEKFVFNSLMSMAMTKYVLGDYKGAEEIWLYVAANRPKSSPPFYNLGNLYADNLKDYPKAESFYKKAIENDPKEISYYRNFFELYAYKYAEKKELAEQVLLDALTQDPKNIDMMNLLGAYYQEQGEKNKAIEYFTKSLKINPNNETIQRELNNLKTQ